jgi:hypothetical protein
MEGSFLSFEVLSAVRRSLQLTYFGGAGVKTSRLLGSGFGLGFGAFLVSFRPLSLLPMTESMTQNVAPRKAKTAAATLHRQSGSVAAGSEQIHCGYFFSSGAAACLAR